MSGQPATTTEPMRWPGRDAAARLLEEAQQILQREGHYCAVDIVGPLRLLAEIRCAIPEPLTTP